MAIVQVSRRESGLPVVSMYDFRHERRDGSLADLGRHSRKRGKAQAIVGPIRAAALHMGSRGGQKDAVRRAQADRACRMNRRVRA
jgi:hypothetical protein